MNIITWKAYLRNSYHEYELPRNLVTRSKIETFMLGIIISGISFRIWQARIAEMLQALRMRLYCRVT